MHLHHRLRGGHSVAKGQACSHRQRRAATTAAAAQQSGTPQQGTNSALQAHVHGATFVFPHMGGPLLWASSTGLKLWGGAQLLADLMAGPPERWARHHPWLSQAGSTTWSWQGQRVLELGCGLALCSMTAARLGAHSLATDGDAGIVGVARKNAAANGLAGDAGSAAAAAVARQGTFHAAQLRWGDTAALAQLLPLPVAVIVLSDLVYGSDGSIWDKLVATLTAAAGPDTLILQAETPRREGVLYGDYWETLGRAGFGWAEVDHGAGAERQGSADQQAGGGGGGARVWVLWREALL